jgi:hypothetical protein
MTVDLMCSTGTQGRRTGVQCRVGLLILLLASLPPSAVCGGEVQAADPLDPVIQEIVRHWAKRQQLFRTAIWKARGKGVHLRHACIVTDEYPHVPAAPAEDYVYDVEVALYFDFERNRVRHETVTCLCGNPAPDRDGTRDPFLLHEIYIWDGAHHILYMPRARNPRLKPTQAEVLVYYPPVGMILPDREFAFYAAGLVRTRKATPKPEALRVEPDPGFYRIVGRANHEGRDCVILRSSEVRGGWDEFWVDVARDAAIVRHGYYDGDVLYWSTQTSYTPLGGTWVPARFRHSVAGRRTSLEITECKLNVPLDPELFRLRVEAGTLIQSGKLSAVFVAPRAGDVLRLGPEGPPSARENGFRPGHLTWITAAILAGLCIRVAWILWKRTAQAPQSGASPRGESKE